MPDIAVTAKTIADWLGRGESTLGNLEVVVDHPLGLDSGLRSAGLAFCEHSGTDIAARLRAAQAAVVLVSVETLSELPTSTADQAYIACANPRREFISAVEYFWPRNSADECTMGLNVIHPSAKVHPQACIGAFVTIGHDCEVGESTVIFPGAHIYPRSIIGSNVRIDSGAVIGSPGFGFSHTEKQH